MRGIKDQPCTGGKYQCKKHDPDKKCKTMDYESTDNDAQKQDAEREKIDFERGSRVRAQKSRTVRLLRCLPVKKIRQVPEKTT